MCSFMDEDPMHYNTPYNFQNWGYYEQPPPRTLGLQLMPSLDTKPCLHGGRDPNAMMIGGNGGFHPRDALLPDPSLAMNNYGRDAWASRDKFVGMISPNASFSPGFLETSGGHSLQMLQPQNPTRDERPVKVEEPNIVKEASQSKKRQGGGAPKTPKAKKPRKPKENSNNTVQRAKAPKKSVEVVINGIDMDISGIPIPVCSCTGVPQQCYRWGCGGWQSACCTTNVSMYPLPMSTKRRGARIAGRKMSQGAFKKVLEKLAAEGYNFANPIDLKTHWAKHGTNKFVTIR